MAVKKTKKLSGQTEVTTINTNQKFPMTDTNGLVTLISAANLKTALMKDLDTSTASAGAYALGDFTTFDAALEAAKKPQVSGDNSIFLIRFTVNSEKKSGAIIQQVGDYRTLQTVIYDGGFRSRHIWFTDSNRTTIHDGYNSALTGSFIDEMRWNYDRNAYDLYFKDNKLHGEQTSDGYVELTKPVPTATTTNDGLMSKSQVSTLAALNTANSQRKVEFTSLDSMTTLDYVKRGISVYSVMNGGKEIGVLHMFTCYNGHAICQRFITSNNVSADGTINVTNHDHYPPKTYFRYYARNYESDFGSYALENGKWTKWMQEETERSNNYIKKKKTKKQNVTLVAKRAIPPRPRKGMVYVFSDGAQLKFPPSYFDAGNLITVDSSRYSIRMDSKWVDLTSTVKITKDNYATYATQEASDGTVTGSVMLLLKSTAGKPCKVEITSEGQKSTSEKHVVTIGDETLNVLTENTPIGTKWVWVNNRICPKQNPVPDLSGIYTEDEFEQLQQKFRFLKRSRCLIRTCTVEDNKNTWTFIRKEKRWRLCGTERLIAGNCLVKITRKKHEDGDIYSCVSYQRASDQTDMYRLRKMVKD